MALDRDCVLSLILKSSWLVSGQRLDRIETGSSLFMCRVADPQSSSHAHASASLPSWELLLQILLTLVMSKVRNRKHIDHRCRGAGPVVDFDVR